jgi:hypothetical protein
VELVLRTSMGIRAHPRLTKRETSLGHHGTQSRGCAGQTVRPSPHSISQTSAGKLLITSSSSQSGSREAIPSEPPVAHSRKSVSEGGGEGWLPSSGWTRASKLALRDMRQTHGLIVAAAREHGPSDTRQLVGERDRHEVAVHAFQCPVDPRS